LIEITVNYLTLLEIDKRAGGLPFWSDITRFTGLAVYDMMMMTLMG
jgi:hypothetical protein